MKKIFLLLVILIPTVFTSKAQCPPNIDYEYGNFFLWSCNAGTCGTAGTGANPQALTYPGVPTGPTVQHAIMSGTGLDPIGLFPIVNPLNVNSFSCRIGDTTNFGAKCSQVKYYVRVPVGVNNYSLQYFYALCLEDGGITHSINNQPYFSVNVYDSANNVNVIQCASYVFSQPPGGANLPGFFTSTVNASYHYKPWTPSSISFKNMGGKTVAIEFNVADCALSGHAGYAYIDFASGCKLPVIINGYCPGSTTATLIAPTGYGSYKWFDSTLTTVLGTSSTLNLNPAPLDTTKFWLAIEPYQGLGCPDTIYTYLTAQPKPKANFGFPDHYCSGSLVHFVDSSISFTPGTYINKWDWSFGDTHPTVPYPNKDTLQNPIHKYDSLGTYTVCLVVQSTISCVSDTQCYTIHIDRTPPAVPMFATKDTICGTTDTTTIWWGGTAVSGFKYKWDIGDAELIAGKLDSSGQLVLRWYKSGQKYVGFTIEPPLGNQSDCWVHRDFPILVKGIYPQFKVMGEDSICSNQFSLLSVPQAVTTACLSSSVKCTNPSFATVGNWNNCISCGTGTTSFNLGMSTPFAGYFEAARFQFLYTAAELTAAGLKKGYISSLAFNVKDVYSTATYDNYTLKLGCVNYNQVNPKVFDTVTPLTQVFFAASYAPFQGMNVFPFSSTYVWDGQSSLLVEVCHTIAAGTVHDNVSQTTTSFPSVVVDFAYTNTTPGCKLNLPYYSTFYTFNNTRPDIRFGFCPAYIPSSTTYLWTSSPTTPGFPLSTPSISVSPTVDTKYYLVADDNGCVSSDSFMVYQLSRNKIYAGVDTNICAGGILTLKATATGPIPPVYMPCGISATGCSNPTIKTLGTGNDQSAAATPFNQNLNNARILMQYSAADLGSLFGNSGGPVTITSIALNVVQLNSSWPYSNFTINMGCTTAGTILGTKFPSIGTNVYAPSNVTPVLGWNTFALTNPYNWDGVSDLLVEACYSGGLFSASDVVEKTVKTGNNCVLYGGNASSPAGCQIISGTLTNTLPNMKFGYCLVPTSLTNYSYTWSAYPSFPSPFVNGNTSDTVDIRPTVGTNFTVSLIGSDPKCPVTDMVYVKINSAAKLKKSVDTTTCVGSKITLWAKNAGASPIKTYQWKSKRNNPISCTTCANPIITNNTKDTILLTVILNNGCTASDSILIDTIKTPSSSFTVQHDVCLGDSVQIKYTGNGAFTDTYTWMFGGGSSISNGIHSQGPHKLSWSSHGMKYITLTVSDGVCSSTFNDSTYVVPILSSTFTLDKHTMCANETVTATYTGNSIGSPRVNFNWSATGSPLNGGGTNPYWHKFTYNTPGTYIISYTADYGSTAMCKVLYTDTILVYPIPTSSFSSSKLNTCSNSPVVLTYLGTTNPNGGPVTFTWNFDGANLISAGVNPSKLDTTVSWTNNSNAPSTKNLTLKVVQNGCVSTTTQIPVKVHIIPNAEIDVLDSIVCSGDNIIINSTNSLVEDKLLANYNWSSSPVNSTPAINGFTGIGQSGPHNISYQQDSVSMYVTLGLFIVENGCLSDTDFVKVKINPQPIPNFSISPNPICSGDSSYIKFTGVVNPLGGASIMAWNFQNGIPNNAIGNGPIKVKFSNPGISATSYSITLNVTQDLCSSAPFIQPITINALPYPVITGKTDICYEAFDTLGTAVAYNTYQWSNGQTSPTIIIQRAGEYFVNVVDANGCKGTGTTNVYVHPIPVADAGVDQIVFVGNSALLDASNSAGGDSYLWSPAATLDNKTVVQPLATPTTTTTYALTYFNSKVGCVDYDTVVVTVKGCEPLILPNAFSPNGDGIDETFMVLNPNDFYRLVRLEIYNRWGQLVYATNDKNSKGWDGKFRGQDCSSDTYIFRVTSECGGGALSDYKGNVTLLR